MKYSLLITFFFLCCSLAFTQENVRFAETRPPYMSVSPTMKKLEETKKENLEEQLSAFLAQCKKDGLPLIEKNAVYADYVYVTFIYQNTEKYTDIKLFIPGIYDEYRFGDMKMYQLHNTDLYYRTYLLPNNICISYRFDVKNKKGATIKELDKFNSNRIPKGDSRSYSYSVLDLSKFGEDWCETKHYNTGSRVESFVHENNSLNNKRDIYVYLPPNYDKDKPNGYPVVYLFDAFVYMNRVEVPVVLDNLITEKKIEPIIAVMLDNPTSNSRYTEYPLNFEFKDAIVSEFIPLIQKRYNVSTNPQKTVIGGMSYGGLAAAFFAYYHPDIFGNVLSQSGSFWRDLELKDLHGNEFRNDWLPYQFLSTEKKDITFFLDWGLQENMVLGSNRNFVKILDKKKYKYHFVEFNGWHNWANTRRMFPIGLMFLLNK